MKIRTDFVSNSSSCCYMFPLSKTHDKSEWSKNTLRPFPDNKKLQMEFDDFSHSGIWDSLRDRWAFVCTQLIYWVIPGIVDGTNKTKKRLLRELYNSEEFLQLQTAVIEYLKDQGVECDGIELDEEEIIDHSEDGDGNYRILRPECNLDHESIFGSFEEMMKISKCDSIAELIWGVKEIKVSWS